MVGIGRQGEGRRMIRLPNVVVTLLQALIFFPIDYAIFVMIPTITTELRTKLWIQPDNKNIYLDKWDFIHWGCALLSTLAWPDPKKRHIVAVLGVFVALVFELYEQVYLCQNILHKESCEPWQDTAKDVMTALIGIITALINPETVTGLGLIETLIWTLAALFFMPHLWWYGIVMYTFIIHFLCRFKDSPLKCRLVGFVISFTGLAIRFQQGSMTLEMLFPSVQALTGITLVSIFVKLLDYLRPPDEDTPTKPTQQLSPPKKAKKVE
eukprot:TRINITY_DN25954_c0_g1_i1.p1 TRINITY_DN25954_c0_g1~~TRINITY_DN25954_c0_g1_i1.p1  ORF type:complete len:267 (-),score=26.03 TRINITY_DN25954_c0_g1_i1:61-861(-)